MRTPLFYSFLGFISISSLAGCAFLDSDRGDYCYNGSSPQRVPGRTGVAKAPAAETVAISQWSRPSSFRQSQS